MRLYPAADFLFVGSVRLAKPFCQHGFLKGDNECAGESKKDNRTNKREHIGKQQGCAQGHEQESKVNRIPAPAVGSGRYQLGGFFSRVRRGFMTLQCVTRP